MTDTAKKSALRRSRPGKISSTLAREILDDIIQRKLPTGSMLPAEAVMSEQYNVGRGSLREAMRILEVLGLISLKPGPGGGPVLEGIVSADYARTATFYYHASGATMGDLLQSRLALEPAAARIVAQQHTPEGMRLLNELIATERLEAENDVVDLPAWSYSDTLFHHHVAQMSGNPIIALSCSSLIDVHLDRVRLLPAPPQRQRVLVNDAHRTIADALAAGDEIASERLMRDHVANMVKYLRKRHPDLLQETVAWSV